MKLRRTRKRNNFPLDKTLSYCGRCKPMICKEGSHAICLRLRECHANARCRGSYNQLIEGTKEANGEPRYFAIVYRLLPSESVLSASLVWLLLADTLA